MFRGQVPKVSAILKAWFSFQTSSIEIMRATPSMCRNPCCAGTLACNVFSLALSPIWQIFKIFFNVLYKYALLTIYKQIYWRRTICSNIVSDEVSNFSSLPNNCGTPDILAGLLISVWGLWIGPVLLYGEDKM